MCFSALTAMYTLTDYDHLTITVPDGRHAYCTRTPEDYDDYGENDYSIETAILDHNWD